mmetsp:Transcript_78522/g.123877  ORF Transcript_78522/g.123877 Transcript_78522/m.123877 type:complete len:220 (+) Transcript_78522:29-688(+)
MSLQCRGTFLEVVEHVDLTSRSRRHSEGAEVLRDRANGSQDRLLQKAADSFAWYLDAPISCGSYGHPELCAAPCIRAFYSKCTKGLLCEFCHFGHSTSKVKLNMSERQLFETLEEGKVLSLVLSVLTNKCQKLPVIQQDVMRLLLAAIQSRVSRLGDPAISRKTRSRLLTLRKFSIGRLFELIQQSHQVDASLKLEVRSLLTSARAAVQRLEMHGNACD